MPHPRAEVFWQILTAGTDRMTNAPGGWANLQLTKSLTAILCGCEFPAFAHVLSELLLSVGFFLRNKPGKSIWRYDSNIYLHYLAVNLCLASRLWPLSEVLEATLKQSVPFLGIPTRDACTTRVLGMVMPKTRGCPYHCDSAILHYWCTHPNLLGKPKGLGHLMKFTQRSIPYRFGFDYWLGLSADRHD